jgi:class 3 adenylate cyclase/pimeloyl-ACP methyl ester carboxylesterase
MEPRIRYARTSDGVNIAYSILGEGPTLIWASNIWGDLHLFRHVPFVQVLYQAIAAAGLRVVLNDARGMGSSDRSEAGYGVDARVLDIDAIADAIGADQFFLGGSAGGVQSAVAYAAARPERVLKLVLGNGYVRGSDWYELIPTGRLSSRLQGLAKEDWETYTSAVASSLMNFGDSESAAGLAAAMRSSATPEEGLGYMKGLLESDVFDRLPLVQAPALVVHFTPLLPGTLKFLREMAATIPDAQFAEVEMGPAYGSLLADFLLGSDQQGGTPQATPFRAVLFTDLVGHTEMMRRLGDDKGRAVLREHEALTREVLKQHGGSEVKSMGDGFMASFPSVTRGVECAIALQKAIAERNATTEEPLNVRVGLNAGEPIEEDGDLFGETVILAARIAASAQGGEILSSMVVRELCAGKGFPFADRGEHVMKGFEDAVRVFEISWRD